MDQHAREQAAQLEPEQLHERVCEHRVEDAAQDHAILPAFSRFAIQEPERRLEMVVIAVVEVVAGTERKRWVGRRRVGRQRSSGQPDRGGQGQPSQGGGGDEPSRDRIHGGGGGDAMILMLPASLMSGVPPMSRSSRTTGAIKGAGVAGCKNSNGAAETLTNPARRRLARIWDGVKADSSGLSPMRRLSQPQFFWRKICGLARLGSENRIWPPGLRMRPISFSARSQSRWWRTLHPRTRSNVESGNEVAWMSCFSKCTPGCLRAASVSSTSATSTAVRCGYARARSPVNVPVPQPTSRTFQSPRGGAPAVRKSTRRARRISPAGVLQPQLLSFSSRIASACRVSRAIRSSSLT